MLCLFSKGNPSVESGKICGTFQGRNGKWENQVCDRKLGYICQKRNSSSDSSTIASGKLVKHKAIFAVSEEYWEDAIYEMTVYCQNKKVTLVDLGQTLRRL